MDLNLDMYGVGATSTTDRRDRRTCDMIDTGVARPSGRGGVVFGGHSCVINTDCTHSRLYERRTEESVESVQSVSV